ncbi:chromatin assembly factor 1 subunit A-domain-containing protein [Xylariaceae sp. FL0016]|nr:chromatin assembly factor 1 subunit A-domain-containing protein [Xylariaceae sp. FL0016]
MPLFDWSPSIEKSEAVSRKRSHQDFLSNGFEINVESPFQGNPLRQKTLEMDTSTVHRQPELVSVPDITMNSPPHSSSPADLTEPGSRTPSRGSPSPDPTPSKLLLPQQTTSSQTTPVASTTLPATSGTAGDHAPAKKRKVTAAEKEQERIAKKQKQDDAAAEKAKVAADKEAAKIAKAAEKAKLDAEREATKAAKAAQKQAKADEKAKTVAEREAKKQKKQEEELAEQRKKEKQANILAGFLKKTPTTPSKKADPKPKTEGTSPAAPELESKPTKSAYDLKFQPFFVKEGVTLATTPFDMDEETKEVKSSILDEYIRGERGEFSPKPFDAAKVFDLAFPRRRGIIPPSVKKIMEKVHGDPYESKFGISKQSESQNEKLVITAQDKLEAVPMKYLRFYEDVRPAYYGTATLPECMTVDKLRHLSRRPTGRILPLVYDYDSEAEWVEDEGEDLDDAEDDEEDIDGDDEMDDFVDDSDAVALQRSGFANDSQPVSTGICFEDQKKMGSSATVFKYRLEFLLDTLEHHSMIDPFSTSYWPSPAKRAVSNNAATIAASNSSMPPPTTGGAFAAITGNAASKSKDLVPNSLLPDFKRTLVSDECREYSKSTVIEMLAKKFATCTKAQVKATLDAVAHRITVPGEKKSVKHWALLPSCVA